MRKIFEEWRFVHGYEVACEGSRVPFAIWIALHGWSSIWHRIKSIICRFKGHDWEDESYGGPESGCMAGTCKCCGYSFHTQLY